MVNRFLVICCLILLWESTSGYEKTLRLVNLVYRHGDRSPVSTYPYNNVSNAVWPNGLGWLTVEGERQHYSLGRFLRRRYDGFINAKFYHKEFRIESSGKERCLMSAYSNLAGLYPPLNNQLFDPNIRWQPIPVETKPRYEDNMVALNKPCKKYDDVYYAFIKEDRVQNFENEHRALFDLITEKSGLDVNVDNFWKVSDTIYCQKRHNFTIPDWVNDTLLQQMLDVEAFGMETLYYKDILRRLMGGPLLKQWILNADKNIAGEWPTKMQVYSGHDTTVTAMLSALRVNNALAPPFTSTVIMELHHDTDYFVQLYFRNRSSEDPNDDTQPHQLTLPGCEFKCPYDKFVKLTADMIPGDWDAECENTEGSSPDTTSQDGLDYKQAFLITVCVYSVVCVCLIIDIILLIFRRNRRAEKASA